MGIHARIILDSGSFLAKAPGLLYPHFRVGYFQCAPSSRDVRIYADGEQIDLSPAPKLGGSNETIDVIHVGSNGTRSQGVTISTEMKKSLLSAQALYGSQTIGVEEGKFDSILLFHSGHFRCSMQKKRYFREIDPLGTPTATPKKEIGPIGHDVIVLYDLADGDELRLETNGQILWTSTSVLGISKQLDIEVLADDATAIKYYRDSLASRASYWIPNDGNPPPSSLPGDPGGPDDD